MKKLTRTEARKAINWFRQAFGLEDWSVLYTIQDGPPAWINDPEIKACGQCQCYVRQKTARIWVSPALCEADELDQMRILLHECVHMLLDDARPDGQEHDSTRREEFMVDRLDTVVLFAYRRGMKP